MATADRADGPEQVKLRPPQCRSPAATAPPPGHKAKRKKTDRPATGGTAAKRAWVGPRPPPGEWPERASNGVPRTCSPSPAGGPPPPRQTTSTCWTYDYDRAPGQLDQPDSATGTPTPGTCQPATSEGNLQAPAPPYGSGTRQASGRYLSRRRHRGRGREEIFVAGVPRMRLEPLRSAVQGSRRVPGPSPQAGKQLGRA